MRAWPLAILLLWAFPLGACPSTSTTSRQAPESDSTAEGRGTGSQKVSITPQKLDAYVNYRRRRLELERASLAGSSSGSNMVERRAEAEETARRQTNLSVGDVRALQRIVDAVIGKRVLLGRLQEGPSPDTAALIAKLPPSAQKSVNDAAARTRKDSGCLDDLAREREQYGNANVDLVLGREAELAQLWQEAMTQMRGYQVIR